MEYTEEKPAAETQESPVREEETDEFQCMNYYEGGLMEFEDEANAARDDVFERQFFMCGC
ncbi:MAG: hypothetical protein WC712_15165 [Candidatus Brocadiia bacterium]